MTPARCVSTLGLILLLHGCGPPSPALTQPSPVVPQTTNLSGQVFEVLASGRAPAANIPLLAVVVTSEACASPCRSTTRFTYWNTTSGSDGRYALTNLPPGAAVILEGSTLYQQTCGAGTELSADTRLDVEITSHANPQRSPTMTPLRVSGQVYEMTASGRIGIAGASIGLEHHAPDAPFLDVVTDADGRYTICGIPRSWPIAFWVGKSGYSDSYTWRSFGADGTLDIELQRR
jgi:hypothetical protein